jgi:anaerobic selenocysteine-containing dehydrogenase
MFGLLSKTVCRTRQGAWHAHGARLQDSRIDLTKVYDANHTGNGKYDPTRPGRSRCADGRHLRRTARAWRRAAAARRWSMGAVPVISPPPQPDQPELQRLRPQGHPLAAPRLHREEGGLADAHRSPAVLHRPPVVPRRQGIPADAQGATAFHSKYPLRIYGGHNRWSIHSIWRDVKLLLRLQRGQPACWMNPAN